MTNPTFLTAEAMRRIEQEAIDSGLVTGLGLMERAGTAAAEAILAEKPEARRAVILCGPGNNGGDGYVIARRLAEAGVAVTTFSYGDPERLPPDAKANAERWRAMCAERAMEEARALSEEAAPGANREAADLICESDVAVDALFGAGLKRGLSAPLAELAMCWGSAGYTGRVLRVAIDAPTGLCMDSGRELAHEPLIVEEDGESVPYATESAFAADLTLTFHRPRQGHVLGLGPVACGRLKVLDIGLEGAADETRFIRPFNLPRKRWSHKYGYGHCFVVSGPMGRSGAARLAARAALRIGAGLVTVAAPPSAMLENACQLTAIMLRKMKGPEGLAALLEDKRVTSVVIGPGCGLGEETRRLVETALAGAASVVLDADALTSFAEAPERLFERLDHRHILTPHEGEFARLFPDLAARFTPSRNNPYGPLGRNVPKTGPAYAKTEAALEAARRCGASVLLKGPDTVIAYTHTHTDEVDIVPAAYERAAPWLATAGSGDVLAGMIGGMAAMDWNHGPDAPAYAAAVLHQDLGRRCGPGLIAEDLPEAIPALLRNGS